MPIGMWMALYGISVFLVSAGIWPGFQPSLCPALPTAKPLFMISPSSIGLPVPGCPLVSTRSIGTGLLEDSASYEVRSTSILIYLVGTVHSCIVKIGLQVCTCQAE